MGRTAEERSELVELADDSASSTDATIPPSLAGSCRRLLSKVSAWCCSSCSQSACCRRGQEGVWSLDSSEVGALSPAWCTPCESGPVPGPRPGLAEVARARMSAQCVIKLCARLRGWGCWTRMPQSAVRPCRTPCPQRDVRGGGRSLGGPPRRAHRCDR